MAVEPLRPELIEAGEKLLAVLDELGLNVHAAAWLYFPDLEDWRYYVATPLVEEMGRKRVYGLLADALDVIGAPEGMTIFDLHLDGSQGGLFAMLTSMIGMENGRASFQNCRFNNIPVDAMVYRSMSLNDTTRYPKKAAKAFERNVLRILDKPS